MNTFDLHHATDVEILDAMRLRGLRVDRKALARQQVLVGGRAEAARTRFKVVHGFDALSRKLPFGTSSTAKEVLQRVEDPRAELVIKVRELCKRSQNLTTLLRAVQADDRVRWEWSVAKTNRVYATHQLLTLAKECRQFVIPDTGKFVVYDYVSQELRVIAAATQNERLLHLLEKGDVHGETAKILGWPRDRAKTFHYALMYGTEIDAAQERYGIPHPKMQEILRNFPIDELYVVARDRAKEGKVETLLGTWLAFDEDDDKTRTNYLCQGTGADILRAGLVTLAREFGLMPAMVMHDAFMLDDVEADAPTIAAGLELEIAGVKFPVEMKQGKTWADVTG